jgi:ribosome modulation factor
MPEMIPQGQRADGPLVHRMVHKGDRPGFQGGSEWACPFCAHQVDRHWLHQAAIAWTGVDWADGRFQP